MARKIAKLSQVKVAALVKAGKAGLYGDGAGLALSIGRGGAASWIFRYMRDGKSHEMGLGAFHTIGLSEARDRARRHRQELLDGIDPLAQRRAASGAALPAVTFGEVAEMYIAAHAPTWKSETHRRQWSQSLADYVLPLIGGTPVAAVATADVMQAVEPLWHAKPETANRVRSRIEAVLDYAAARQWRVGDNPARWRGHLANLLPAPHKVAPVAHHRAMPWTEIPAFMARLGRRTGVAARCLQLLILTAARSGEARGAVWGEIDLDAATWTVPAARMKAGRPHRVPLSAPARAILRGLLGPKNDPAAFVFPGGKPGKPLSDVALSNLLPDAATVHGMRSSFRDWAAEATGVQREVAEAALAHAIGDKVEAAYRRGDLFEKRRELMDAWAAFCTGAWVP